MVKVKDFFENDERYIEFLPYDYKSMLRKCDYEFNSLRKDSPETYIYNLINIIMGLNHLFEWFIKDKSIEEEFVSKCIKSFNPFESPYDVSFKDHYRKIDIFPEVDLYQMAIRKLCNNIKHFKKNDKTNVKSEVAFTASAGEEAMGCGEKDAICGAFENRYYVEVNEKNVQLEELLKKQLDKWKAFIKGLEKP